MSKTASRARKILLAATVVALGLMMSPPLSAKAQAALEPGNPPAVDQLRGWRLERAWLRQQRLLDRLSFMFDHIQQRINRAQEFIDQAKAKGKDTAALQAALDAFGDGIGEARPIFEGAQGIISSHKGFDANGEVTDAEAALQTIQQMEEELGKIRSILFDPAHALREALRAFWQANRHN